MATNFKCLTPAKPSNSSMEKSKVRVIVRVRPFLAHEISSKKGIPLPCASILTTDAQVDATHEVPVHLKDHETSRQDCFKLDGFFGEEDNNVAKIFEKEVKNLIPGVFHGCNATVFAYGATGSGKTYTMQGTDVQPGLMPLAMSTVLSMCQATGSIVEISCYEVYLDRCYDQLELKAKEISVLDDKEGQIHLRGLSRVPVTSMSEFYDVFARGIQRRKVAHTGLNDVSSRSHGVLVVTVSKPSDQGVEASIIGKLNLIDLAGNEDNRRSGSEGIRLQESAKINQSLFALSNVIYALNNNKPWVPYRETKLTRILQDSLGGTSRALMVACLNPGGYQEAVHTVSLAARSRHVSNIIPSAQIQETPKLKIDMEAKLQAWLESKGKTKSAQRKEAFGSPFLLRSPGYNSSMKKQAVLHSSVKVKAANQVVTVKDSFMSVPQKKLFDSEATFDPCKDDELECLEDLNLRRTNEVLTVLDGKSVCQKFVKDSVIQDSKEQFARLEFNGILPGDELLEEDEKANNRDGNCIQSPPSRTKNKACQRDELLEEDEKANNRDGNYIQSSPSRTKNKACQSPLRKALSPIISNITRLPIEEVSSRDNVLSLLIESSAPRTPFFLTREKLKDCDTPLDKFNARSSNLKSYLAQEYIDFLNTATREELTELKGIGVKRAEYIIELRESSPLKSLSDLEYIGLSSKQVQHMFSKAAKGIFG